MNRTLRIQRVLSGEASKEELKEMEAWIAKDAANKLEFDDVSLLWKYSNKRVDGIDLNTSDFQNGLLKIETAIEFLKRKKKRSRILALIGIVVSMFLMMIIVYFFYEK